MSVLYGDIYDVATFLVGQKTSDGTCCEASLRSAASRAYYAALHASLKAVPIEFFPTEAELNARDSHNKILDAIVAWGNSTTPGRTEANAIRRELPRLKRLRKTADYSIDSDFSENEAIEALARSSRILQHIATALNKSSPLQTA